MQDTTRTDERPVNVLLVDDQPANLLALEAVLADLGQNLVKADSGERALQLLQNDDFAVVLLDVQMAGLDGFETAQLIRSGERTRHTPIIFLTAHDSHRLPVEAAYALGAVDYLVKPVHPVILRAKVSGFVELFRKTEQIKRQAEQLRLAERREFEQKLAKENARLRESEQRFARFMQYLPGLAWIKDWQGRYVYVNDAAEKAFRTPRVQLYGKTDDEIFPPETAVQFKENDRKAQASGTGVQVIETLEHADGMRHSSIVNKFPIAGPDGRPALVGGMAVDITDRLRAEEALQEEGRRKDEFLATLAHELRNPLAPLRNALHVMQQPAADAAILSHVRELAERQVQHMARLLDDLLDVSRISRGRIELRKEPVDLATLVTRTVDAARPLLEERRHELSVALPAGPVRVQGDPTRLEQVLTNLLHNAAKYTEPGGRIWLTAGREGGEAVLRVRDTGIGLAPDMLPRIFDLFVQAERRLDRARGGVGIGLTLVKRLVELHGGSVAASSAGLGQGSEFVVYLPALADEGAGAEEKPRAVGPSVPPLPCRRVLVVDDSPDAADSLALLLRLEGQDVRVAYDGPAALALARDFRPGLVLLDLGMPGMDGYEVARRLRQQPGHEKMLLVALTGWGQDEDRRRTQAAGFDQHLTKPVEPSVLHQLLAQAVR